MKGKIFIDTNCLVYMFSRDEQTKRHILINIFKEHSFKLVWSTQVIQEFYNIAVKKLRYRSQDVKTIIDEMSHLELIINNLNTIKSAIDVQTINQISFWHSLIVSAAKSAHCKYLLSEDMQHGQKINGIEVANPFI
ncbi:MAG: PIN domain-containing protein [Cyclobacteriaceae bacterium]